MICSSLFICLSLTTPYGPSPVKMTYAARQDGPSITLDFTKPGVAVSPSLYGLMTEEINYSYDGGLYGELVRNRAFKDDEKRPAHWVALPDGSIELQNGAGPSKALTAALKVQGGVTNDGYWGFPIRPGTTYRLSVWAKADKPGPMTATLESNDGATIFAKGQLKGLSGDWHEITASLKTSRDLQPTKDAHLVLRTGKIVTSGFPSSPSFHQPTPTVQTATGQS